MNKIPVFLHIPKNAGTYVLGVTMELFRHYGISKGWRNELNWNLNLRRILLQKGGIQIATLFVYDPYKTRNSNPKFKHVSYDDYCNLVELHEFEKKLKNKNLNLFSIIVEDHGTKYIKNGLFKSLCETVDSIPFYYTVLREPYDRALSMFNYIKSSKSIHEPTHNKVICDTFIDYINSPQLEDSWLVRRLNGISDEEIITEKEFINTCYILENFYIKDIKYVEEMIDDVFLECYGIKKSSFSDFSFNVDKNSTQKKIIILFNELEDDTKKRFLSRTEFDRKIYNKYCK
jgi:hypothetical protein